MKLQSNINTFTRSGNWRLSCFYIKSENFYWEHLKNCDSFLNVNKNINFDFLNVFSYQYFSGKPSKEYRQNKKMSKFPELPHKVFKTTWTTRCTASHKPTTSCVRLNSKAFSSSPRKATVIILGGYTSKL